jgi:hypothetical protein
MPWETRIAVERLERGFGWKVQLDRIAHPRPGVEVYENLEFIDAETGESLLRCASIELSRRDYADPQGEVKPTLVLALESPEIEAAAIDRLRRSIERILQRQTAADSNCLLSAAELKVRRGKQTVSLPGIDSNLVYSDAGIQAYMQFHLPGDEAAVPAFVRIVRNRTINPPQNCIELKTENNDLPCELLALASPAFAGLGPQARFRGDLHVYYVPRDGANADLGGDIVGQFSDVDIGGVVRAACDQKITGTADIALYSPTYFADGRLESLSAVVKAGSGTIDRSLLQACVDQLGCGTDLKLEIADDEIRFQQMAFELRMSSEGIDIRGRCPFRQSSNDVRGVVAIDGNQRLLFDPAAQPRSVASLIQALAPSGSYQVPVSRQADKLMRHLPLPNENEENAVR